MTNTILLTTHSEGIIWHPAFIALALIVFPGTSTAMTKAEICSFRGEFVGSFAQARDEGKTRKQTTDQLRREMSKKGLGSVDFAPYIKLVYDNPDIKPSVFRQLAELSCLKE